MESRGSIRALSIAMLLSGVATCGLAACSNAVLGVEEDELGVDGQALVSQLVWPISASVTRTSAAPGHGGIDLGAVVGTPVFAVARGRVVSPFVDPGGYGCNIVLNHSGGDSIGAGLISVYAHMNDIVVAPGEEVAQGALIGYSGGARGAPCAGNSGGPHLHFEIRRNLSSVRGWDASVSAGSRVNARDPIDAFIEGLPAGTQDCDAACAQFGCQCVDGQCSGGFCPGTGCTQQETDNCAAFGVGCVDHQCAGAFGEGSGCTARETLDCAAFGANCVDHRCSGGYGEGTGCTAGETLRCGNFGVNCVDHQCSGGYGPGTGCTAGETLRCASFGANCVDHQCSGGYGEGTGCTARETADCGSFGCGCVDHQCSGGFCPGTGCTARETSECEARGVGCADHRCTG